MRINGTLKKWFDDRGFGFVVTSQYSGEIFVHISAFPKAGSRPQIGELISFVVETDKDGKKRAIEVMRLGESNSKTRQNKSKPKGNRTSIKGSMILVSIMLLSYVANKTEVLDHDFSSESPTKVKKTTNHVQPRFKCDGRQHCSQMSSRAEAEYFIKHCPDKKMDGDNDGIPCERNFSY